MPLHPARQRQYEDFLISIGFGTRNASGVFVPVIIPTGTSAPTGTVLGTVANAQATPTAGSTTSSLTVTGNSVANASSYRLYYAATSGGVYTQLGGTLATPNYLHGGLAASTQAYYKWLAVGNGTAYVDGPLSAEFNGKTADPPQVTTGFAQYAVGPQYTPVKPTTWEDALTLSSSGDAGTTRTISGRKFKCPDGAYTTADIYNVNDNLIIENCDFTGITGALMRINLVAANASVIIRNCRFWGMRGANPVGFAIAVNSEARGNVQLLNNFISDSNGIRWEEVKNNTGVCKIIGNDLRNINHFKADGTSDGQSSGIQFIHCRPINLEIAYNSIYGEPGKVTMGDGINFYGCQGTSANWIRVHDNIVFGHYPWPLDNIVEKSGSCYTTDGEIGGSLATDPCFIEFANNYSVRHTFGAMNVAGGHDIKMVNNRMVSTGKQKETGAPMGGYSAGIGCYDYLSRGSAGFYNLTVTGNILGEVNPQGNRADNTSTVVQTSQQTLLPLPITAATEDEQWQRWVADCVAASITPGSILTAAGVAPA